MVTGFNHICLRVKDIEATKRFYCGLLDFRQGPEFTSDKGKAWGGYLYLSRRMFIEYILAKEPVEPFKHFCLEVDDLKRTVAKLRAAGVETTDIYFGRSKAWIASFEDPDGNLIELNEFSHPESWIRRYLEEVEGQEGESPSS
jgi:catechol 2,3-dioxygenase-like lactoylglutathione lyase family enzyme